jgi:sn-glycerol 3-phosphate transport system permease protein
MPLLPGRQLPRDYRLRAVRRQDHCGGLHAPVAADDVGQLVTALVIAIGKIAISLLSAFAIVYFRFPLRNLVFWAIFVTLMLPVEVRIGPTYQVVSDLNMLNTYAGLTMPLIASATATFLFRQFFLTVPDELVEAARMDGAGPMRFFKDVLLPLSKTSIAALFVIQFIYGWNQYLWPLLVTTERRHVPGGHGHQADDRRRRGRNEWNVVMATAILAMLPPALVVILMQKWFVKGLVDTEKNNGFHSSWQTSSRRYGKGKQELQVIHGVNAEIADREFIVIVGPSGCGKSTLLRMVAGLEEVSGGEIAIGGRVVNELEPAERDIAMVFQNYALYPHMSVFDNMATA